MPQRSLSIWIGLVACLALAIAGCGGGSSPTGTTTSSSSTATTTSSGSTGTTTGSKAKPAKSSGSPAKLSIGYPAEHDGYRRKFLVDGLGWTLYAFGGDSTGGSPTCVGKCAKVWLPLLTSGQPEVLFGFKLPKNLIGEVERPDGTEQVTYAGHPLYTFSKEKTGRIHGVGRESFGATWSAIAPTGELIESL
jgi:predicted lipoprotein with Yx(FWY)xxD motif